MQNFDYYLPSKLIAQTPAKPRDHSRLLMIDKKTGHLAHHAFYELPQLLRPTDVLVFNQSQVIPARLYGFKSTGGKVEILLLRRVQNHWEYISHPGLKPGQIVKFSHNQTANIISPSTLTLSNSTLNSLSQIGIMPLPPYIHSHSSQKLLRRQYQTIYASQPGSSAAPTAGLHFTHRLLNKLSSTHQLENLTLHVGLGTFKTPTPEQIKTHTLHSEWFSLNTQTAKRLNQAKKAGRRIIAVGTTTCRVLETCTTTQKIIHPQTGDTRIFIQPPYKFKFVDGLITNFHLPKSSLLMLVSALASPQIIQKAYQEAIRLNYRFYSFGDACFITDDVSTVR